MLFYRELDCGEDIKMEKSTKQKIITALQITGNVLMYLFFALCLFVLLLSIISKRDVDGAVEIFGYEMRIVLTGSMEKNEYTWDDVKQYEIKNVPKYSAVFIELVPDDEAKADEWYAELKKGDVLTFRYFMATRQETITHRIDKIESKTTGGYIITLKAENGSGTPDDWTPQIIDTSEKDSPNYVIGKVTGKSYVLGRVVNAVKQPIGIGLIIIIPCSLIIIFEIIRIVNVLNEEKRRKAEASAQEQHSEMEELRRRIAELEGNKVENPANGEENA